MKAIRKHLRDFVALIVLVVIAVAVGGYILANQRARFPLIQAQPQTLYVELADAQAVIPGQGQTVRVSGVEIGQLGPVRLDDGRALVELQVEDKYRGMIREDATALLRPRTGLKDMFIEVDPGVGRALEENGRIPITNTAPDVDPDEILSALDRDTRSYLLLLIGGAGRGLEGRGEDLRQTLKRLEPFHRDLARLNTAVARRRGSLKQLINSYGKLTEELSRKDEDLTQLVGASNQVFESLAAERDNIAGSLRRLPGTLRQTEATLSRVGVLGERLPAGLNALRPGFRQLDETNAAVRPFVREAAPIVRDQIRPFTRAGQPFLRNIGPAARDTQRALPDLTRSFNEFNRLFNIAAYNPGGAQRLTGDMNRDRNREEGFLFWLAWASQNGVSVHNTSDAQGVFRRLTLCGLSPEQATSMVGPALADVPAAQVPNIVTTLVSSSFGTCDPSTFQPLTAPGAANPLEPIVP